jgi:molecular chaperone GrpE
MKKDANDLDLNNDVKVSPSQIRPDNKEEVDSVELENSKKELKELNDKYLRLYAEFDNFKKRKIKEDIEIVSSATSRVILEILPIIDDFERALENFAINKGDVSENINEGVKLIYDKLISTVKKQGVEAMDVKSGDDFNIDLHESVANTPIEDQSLKGKVANVIQKGYLLNNRIIRFAKVIIYS